MAIMKMIQDKQGPVQVALGSLKIWMPSKFNATAKSAGAYATIVNLSVVGKFKNFERIDG